MKEQNKVEPPKYIKACDEAMEQLKNMGTNDEIAGMCFFHNKFLAPTEPKVLYYSRAAAWGNQGNIVESMLDNMRREPAILKIITTAFSTYMLETIRPDESSVVRQDFRRALLAFLNKAPDKDPATAQEDAERIFRLVRAKVPERTSQIAALEKYIKDYRKAGLKDIALCMHQEITRLRNEITADETRAENERQNANRLRQQMQEVGRVRQKWIAERQEQLQLEHDYDSLGRRVRNYRAMIERLTAEMEALQQEQRDLQKQHPQFDPNSAAKKKRQKLAERKRERAARKKKGKECETIDMTRSCSQMLRKAE